MGRSYYYKKSVRYRAAMRRRLRKQRRAIRICTFTIIVLAAIVIAWRLDVNAKLEEDGASKTAETSGLGSGEANPGQEQNRDELKDGRQQISKDSWAGVDVEKDTFEKVRELAYEDERAAYILENPTEYPEAFLDLLARNKETLEFVFDYPKHHGDAPAKQLDDNLDEVPLLIQWDGRWGYQSYGGSTIAVSGCAPTCISMVSAYFTKNVLFTPLAVANYAVKQNYYITGRGTSWELLDKGAKAFGVEAVDLALEQASMNAALDSGELIVCSMKPGDFTDVGHFIVISGYSEEGYTVRDPNSIIRSSRKWSYKELEPQISNLWSCHRWNKNS